MSNTPRRRFPVQRPCQSAAVLVRRLPGIPLDVSDLALEQSNDRWVGKAEVTYVRQAADGRTLGLASRTVNFDVTSDVCHKTLREGLVLGEIIEPVKDLDHVRIIAVDEASGAIGYARPV